MLKLVVSAFGFTFQRRLIKLFKDVISCRIIRTLFKKRTVEVVDWYIVNHHCYTCWAGALLMHALNKQNTEKRNSTLETAFTPVWPI